MTTCATCQSWSLKTSTLARHSYAPCALGASYTALPPQGSCERHSPINQAAADARAVFLAGIAANYTKVRA